MKELFDLRLRKWTATADETIFRVLLLPHRMNDAGTQHEPWDRAVAQEPVSGTEAAPPASRDRRAGDEEQALWLPEAQTKIALRLAQGDYDPFSPTLKRFWIDGTEESPLPTFRAGIDDPTILLPSDGTAEIVCFGGLKELSQSETQAISAVRNSKEFLLYLIEAFRFNGSLEAYASLGQAEMMACLSHLVFEIHSDSGDGLLNADIWNRLQIEVSFPGDLSALKKVEKNSPFEAQDVVPFTVNAQVAEPRTAAPFSIATEQREDGLFFRLLDPKKFHKADGSPNDELKLQLRRSVGPIPGGLPPVVATSYFGFQKVVTPARDGAGETVITERQFHIADRMKADEFAGQQLNYVLEVIDGFGEVYASTSKTLLRELRTPPPAPLDAFAFLKPPSGEGEEWSFGVELKFPNQLLTEIGLPEPNSPEVDDWQKALLKRFSLDLFMQERPLDECGFYGDDDDNALLEGLQQADALYDPGGANSTAPMPGVPLEAHMLGKFDREGLKPVKIQEGTLSWKPVEEPQSAAEIEDRQPPRRYAQLRWTIAFKDGRSPSWLQPRRGYQFHACLSRILTKEVIPGTLTPCVHQLRFDTGEATSDASGDSKQDIKAGVFQIELFPLDRWQSRDAKALKEARRFLASEAFDLCLLERVVDSSDPAQTIFVRQPFPQRLKEVVDDETPPVGVELIFTHPIAGHLDFDGVVLNSEGAVATLEPIGGVRILVRDRVAQEPEMPFMVAETVQVLPRVVTFYRPVQIESGLNLSELAVSLAPDGNPWPLNDWSKPSPEGSDDNELLWAFDSGGSSSKCARA